MTSHDVADVVVPVMSSDVGAVFAFNVVTALDVVNAVVDAVVVVDAEVVVAIVFAVWLFVV